MSQSHLPIDIRAFLATHARSVAHLEMLLLMGTDPSRSWTADELSRELRTNLAYADSQLKHLRATGAVDVASGGDKHYSISSKPGIIDLIERTRELYGMRRSSVIEFIYSGPLEKIHDLADAFMFGKG